MFTEKERVANKDHNKTLLDKTITAFSVELIVPLPLGDNLLSTILYLEFIITKMLF